MQLWVPSSSHTTNVSRTAEPGWPGLSVFHLLWSALRIWSPSVLYLLPRQSNQSFVGATPLCSLPVGLSAAMAGGGVGGQGADLTLRQRQPSFSCTSRSQILHTCPIHTHILSLPIQPRDLRPETVNNQAFPSLGAQTNAG